MGWDGMVYVGLRWEKDCMGWERKVRKERNICGRVSEAILFEGEAREGFIVVVM